MSAEGVALMWLKTNAYGILVEMAEGQRTLQRPRHSLEDNIKLDLREIGAGGVDWLHLFQDRGQCKVFSVRFEVFTAVTMKNGVFWDVTPCGSCKNRRFGGNLAPPSSGQPTHAAKKYQVVFLPSVRRLLVAVCVVPSSPFFISWKRSQTFRHSLPLSVFDSKCKLRRVFGDWICHEKVLNAIYVTECYSEQHIGLHVTAQ
jgi:hypothetical protein